MQQSSPLVLGDVLSGNYPNGVFSFHDISGIYGAQGPFPQTVGPTIVNTLIAGNSGPSQPTGGSGIEIWGSKLTLVNTTVAGNNEGGIASANPAVDTVSIRNSIIYGNTSIDIFMPTAAIDYSIIGTGSYTGGTTVSSADPQFVNPGGGNYHLQATSPAINNGSNAARPGYAISDLDGNPRIVSNDVDMGAYEDQNAADGPAHQAPVADSQSGSTTLNTPVNVTLTGSNPDGGSVSFTITGGGPAHGSLSGSGAGRTYTPANGFLGIDTFTFQMVTAYRTSNTATVTIHVNPVNTAPTANNDSLHGVNENRGSDPIWSASGRSMKGRARPRSTCRDTGTTARSSTVRHRRTTSRAPARAPRWTSTAPTRRSTCRRRRRCRRSRLG